MHIVMNAQACISRAVRILDSQTLTPLDVQAASVWAQLAQAAAAQSQADAQSNTAAAMQNQRTA